MTTFPDSGINLAVMVTGIIKLELISDYRKNSKTVKFFKVTSK